MPLYDCMLLLKPHADKTSLMEIAARFGRHVYNRNGILTDVKCFEKTCLGYGIKKLNGRYCQSFYTTIINLAFLPEPGACNNEFCMARSIAGSPYANDSVAISNLNKELHYLNKEDRLMRCLLVKFTETKYGMEFITDYDGKREQMQFSSCSIYNVDEDDENDDCDEEYEAEEIK